MTSRSIFLFAACSFVLAASPGFAGEKTLFGSLADPDVNRSVLTMSGQNSTPANPSIRFRIPRWDGKDAAGNPMPWNRLREVVLKVRVTQDIQIWIENTSGQSASWWQVNPGIVGYWTWAPTDLTVPGSDGAPAFGGMTMSAYSAADDTLAAFDGLLDGAGPSGYYGHQGLGPEMDERRFVAPGDRQELRRWAGPSGSTVDLYFNPRFRMSSLGFAGHWRWWGRYDTNIDNLWWGSNAPVSVTYKWADQAEPNFRVQSTEAVELAVASVDPQDLAATPVQTLPVPGFSGDPTKLRRVVLEVMQELCVDQGIENLSPFPAICGGSAAIGMRIDHPLSWAPLSYSNYCPMVGSPAELPPFDGQVDFEGSSAVERYGFMDSSSMWTYDSAVSSAGPPLAAWCLPTVEFTARAGHLTGAAVPQTPGASFDWWLRGRYAGRVRAHYFYEP